MKAITVKEGLNKLRARLLLVPKTVESNLGTRIATMAHLHEYSIRAVL